MEEENGFIRDKSMVLVFDRFMFIFYMIKLHDIFKA